MTIHNTDALLTCVGQFASRRVAVLGDLMLDRYIWGSASRLSQEAPVPVVTVRDESSAPGGAANVVRNLASLGAHPSTLGVIGRDRHGDVLLESLAKAGADTAGILVDDSRPTTVKTRVLAGTQQVVRIDRETTLPVAPEMRRRLTDLLAARMRNGELQGVILEDYAKGLLTADTVAEIAQVGRETGVPVSLDPHPGNAFNAKGLALMTPNRREAFALAGLYYRKQDGPPAEDPYLLETGARLLELWEPDMLLITLGGDGMILIRAGLDPVHIPTRAREVFDVSGAGDTVIAAFSLALVSGADPVDAAVLSNIAAGIVVGEVGTAAVSAAELIDAIRADGC